MREFKKRRTRGADIVRVAIGSLGILVLVAVAIGGSRAAWGMYGRFSDAAAARVAAERQLAYAQERYQNIEKNIAELSSDRGIEAELRQRYGVVRPGEGQIDIVRQSTSTEVLRQEPTFLGRLWRSLMVW